MSDIWVVTSYAGQIIDPENFHEQPVFGSELALLEIFSRLSGVTVFISKPAGYIYEKYNITWRSEKDWNELIKSPPKTIVISRYIGSFIDYIMPKECKIYLWVHDVFPHPAYKGINLNNNFMNNIARRLSGIVTVGTSQIKEIIEPRYKLDPGLFITIKNGINAIYDGSHLTRQRAPMSFVYSSGPERGLFNLLKMWPAIVNKWPYATLQIFHDLKEDHFKQIREMNLERVYPMGKVTQTVLFEKLKLIDYWLYPCSFFETCCTTAIEMQYHGIICISNDLGALKENNNGIIISGDDFGNQAFNMLCSLEENRTKKEEIRQAQYLWAREQTWDNRAKDWAKVIKPTTI